MKRTHILGLSVVAAALLAACSSPMPTSAELDKLTQDIIGRSFRAQGQAKLDRLSPDEDNRLCAEAERTGAELDATVVDAIQNRNLQTIKPPSDGKYLGDYKEGEKIAQDGRGKTWTDADGSVNGGNCYNCHQISKEELSYGTLGPSLYNYAKVRGAMEANSPTTKAITEYTWGKIQNARAYNACSIMPRFGHKGILTEAQMKHVMALLLDPASPVNK